MGKIFYIMGKSSSGKDTIFKRLRDDDSLQLQTIVPYTTRPVRDGETEGVEYHFVQETDLCGFEENGQLIEQRSYDTFHGVWKYFTVNDGQINLTKYDYIVIDTPPSLGILTMNALTASNYVIVPVQADVYSLQGIGPDHA